MSPEITSQSIALTAEQEQLGIDMLEICNLEEYADVPLTLKDSSGNITQSGTVKEALVFCEFFHDLEPHVARAMIIASIDNV